MGDVNALELLVYDTDLSADHIDEVLSALAAANLVILPRAVVQEAVEALEWLVAEAEGRTRYTRPNEQREACVRRARAALAAVRAFAAKEG